MSHPILSVRNISKSFGGVQAVAGVSFEVQAGELLAMIGPNGAGKTTCFNMLMGQLPPSGGDIILKGNSIKGLPPRTIWRMGIGRTFQITGTYQSMTVVENVQMALISHHRKLFSILPYARTLYRDEAMELLALVSMEAQADRACSVLAYGDLKRLELAIALAHEPFLLFMDEPTAGMAPSERIALMDLTAEIVRDRHLSVLFTEHDMDVVFTNAHRVIVLDRGELIANGSVEEVRNDPHVQHVYLGDGSLYADEDADA